MADGMQRLIDRERPEILLVHRDADREGLEVRRQQIPDAARPVVRVVPVRMTETWLLLDERAIRCAAQNPNGRVELELPNARKLESLADPKAVLQELILRASEVSGPRRKKRLRRDLAYATHVLADAIADFTALDALPAFRSFALELDRALEATRPAT